MIKVILGKELRVYIKTVHITLCITSDYTIALAEFTRAQTGTVPKNIRVHVRRNSERGV